MKIVHFSKYDRKGGAALAARNSVCAQRRAGADALLCVGSAMGNEAFLIAPHGLGRVRSLARFAIERLPFRLMGRSRYDARSLGLAGLDGPAVAAAVGADLVVLHNIDGLLGLSSLPRFGCPMVWRTHDMWAMCGTEHYVADSNPYRTGDPRGIADPLSRWTFRRKQRLYPKIRSLTICPPSNWLSGEMAASHLLRGRETVTIANGIDTGEFAPAPRAEARRRLGLPAAAPLLLFGAAEGAADPKKGFDLLAAAIARAAPALVAMGAELVTVGGGETGNLPLPVHALGRIGDRARLRFVYAAADVAIAPSRLENLSLMVIEALACGTPVIAFDVGGMPDMIRHGVNGWLVPPFELDRLARTIEAGLVASRAGGGMQAACRASVEGRFDRETEAQGMLALFERILAKAPRQTGATS